MPELPPGLLQVRQLMEAGKNTDALIQIDALLDTDPDVERHSLRLQILLPTLENIEPIVESLQWVKTHASSNEMLPILEAVNTRIMAEVDTLYNSINLADIQFPLLRIDELNPLADTYPAIYTLRGMVNLYMAFVQGKNRSDYKKDRVNRLHRQYDQYVEQCKKSSRPVQRSFFLDTAITDAPDALDKAQTLLPMEHHYYAITVKLMGELHEFEGNIEEAMDFYQEAFLLNLPVSEYIEAIKPQVAERVLKRLIEQIDTYVVMEEYALVEHLLQSASSLEQLADIQVRRGDLAYNLGELTTAETYYKNCLQALDLDREQLLSAIDPSSLTRLRQHLNVPPESPSRRPKRNGLLHLARVFPGNDARHRALAGLIVTYQSSGQAAEAQSLLHELLTSRNLPTEVYPHLVALADRNETLLQQEKRDQLRGEAQGHWQDGRWQAALGAFYNLCGLSAALPEDWAWLAIAIVRTGQPAQILIHTLKDVSLSSLSKLPRDLICELLDRLCQENQWDIINQYIPELKLPSTWRKKYRGHLEAYVQEREDDLRGLMDKGDFHEAAVLSEHLLPLVPGNSELQLLQARAYIGENRLAEAQSILKEIEYNPDFQHAAVLALVEIDVQQGYYQAAQARLDTLEDVGDPDYVMAREALQNRIRRLPALFTEHASSHVSLDSLRRVEGDMWFTIFGVEIVSVRAGQNIPPSLDSCSQFLLTVAQAGSTGIHAQYAWRYISAGGTLSITLLCRVEADSQSASETGAINLWHLLKNVLPQRNEVFAYEPVTRLSALQHILRPFEVQWAAEVARKEAAIMQPGSEEVYLVYPFTYSKGDLRRTLQLMIEQTEPVILDIHFTPTNLFSWERRAITEMIGQERTNLIYDALPGLLETDKPPSDFRQKWVANFYPEFLARTQSFAFIGQIQMASNGRVDASLPSMVSLDLFGTSDLEVLGARSVTDLEVAARNLSEVTCERWIYTAAPDDVPRWRHLLTPDEVLAATRLPTPDMNGVPGIRSLKIRMLPMPEGFPGDGIVIGESAFPVNGRMIPVKAAIQDRLKHTYIVGRTGSGKSTLIQNMALQDIEAGLGVGIIDPHGDLIDAILERIPAHRARDVVLFDPSDQQRPVALNILDVEGVFERNMVIADFIGLLQNMFDPHNQGFVGPRFENIVRQSMLALMEVMKGATLIDVVRMLSDKNFREEIIKQVRDPVVLNYWNNIGKQLDSFGWGSAKGEMIDWLTSKFGRFVDDNMMRYIIGQSRNTIDFEAIMNNRQILLVDLSKGKIGPQNSSFLGLLLVPRLLIAAHRRARLKPDERDPFCLYIDEFQNFTTPSFVEMLSEARKYGVALTMANQFTNQLEPSIREAVFGNVGSLLVFQVGLKDAVALSPELYPVNAEDIINLPNYHLFAKLLMNSQVMSPFPVHTLTDARLPSQERADNIRQNSRLRYGRDLALIQLEIERRFKFKDKGD